MRRLATVAVATSIVVVVPVVSNAGDGEQPATRPTTTATTDTKPADFDPDGLVDAARAGYAEFVAGMSVAERGEYSLAECPWITPAELVAAVAPVGDATLVESEVRTTLEVDVAAEDEEQLAQFVTCDTEEYTEANPDAPGPVYGIGIGVFDYAADPQAVGDLADFIESADTGVVVEPSLDTLGGTVYGYCEENDDLPDGTAACYQFWVKDTFAVGIYAVTDVSDTDTLTVLGAVLLEQLPALFQRIAGGLPPVEIVSSEFDDGTAVDVTVSSVS
jgi:hypothetical protein